MDVKGGVLCLKTNGTIFFIPVQGLQKNVVVAILTVLMA